MTYDLKQITDLYRTDNRNSRLLLVQSSIKMLSQVAEMMAKAVHT